MDDYDKFVDFMAGLGVDTSGASGADLSPTDKRLVDVADFYEEVPAGSHVAIPSHSTGLGPWHHGIYIGNKRVIHMIGSSKDDAHVQHTCFNDFKRGSSVIAVVLYADETPLTLERTVSAAHYLKNMLPVQNLYQILGFNCEHFAVLCKVGPDRCVPSCDHVRRLLHAPCPPSLLSHGKFTSHGPPL